VLNRLFLIVALLFPFGAADGAITTDPSTIAESMRAGNNYPRNSTVYPAKKFITVSGTGAWTAVRAGDLYTGCGGPCFTATPTSGDDAGTVTINWNSYGAESLAVGVYTGTVTIAGNVTTITLTVVTRAAYATFSYAGGYPQGCTNSDSLFSFLDTCTISNERPPSEAFSIPVQGGSYVDPEFGRTVTRITAEGQTLLYSTLTAFTADNSLVMTDNGDTTMNFSNRSGTVIYSGKTRGDTTFTALDALDSDIYWRRSASHELWKHKLSTSTDTKAADYGGTYTSISNGGTADISDDNWWAFFAPTELEVCAVNLNGLTTGNQASKTYCASYSGLLGGDGAHVDFVQVSMPDVVTGTRYVTMMRATAAAVWSVNLGTGTLDSFRYLGEEPQRNANDDDGVCESGETCIAEPHCTLGRDALGNVILLLDWAEIYGNQTFLVSLQLNKTTSMFRPVEEGGGMRFLFADSCTGCDRHLSCNGAGYCSMSDFKFWIVAKEITGATKAKPAEITTSTAHGWTTLTQVEIDQVVGNTCVNDIWTITNTGTYTFTLDGSDCTASGTYAGGGLAGLGNPVTNYPLRGRNIVMYLNGTASFAYPVNHHRGKIWSTGGYWETTMTNISRDGAYIAYATNMGNIGGSGQTSIELAIYIAATGVGGGPPGGATRRHRMVVQ